MQNITITKDNLLSEFYQEYERENNRFLLFDLANANENANTKVLKHLLEYNKGQFLTSFLERVGLPMPNGSVRIKEQEKAIGNKETGFIDLYLEYDKTYVIIENKIYGAGDTDKQLARYIATVNGVKKENFDNWYAQPSIYKDKDIRVVYLTADGTNEPSKDSLPANLKEEVEYYAINYKDDILPWLEEAVLPQLPYGTDGLMIAGVLQYIAFLKQLLADESSDVVNKFIDGLQGTDAEKYNQLLKAVKGNNRSVPENVQKSLRKQLGACAEAIFSADVQGEWVLHFTPSFIILYKKSWAALDTRKYSIPSLHINVGNTNAFMRNKYFNNISLVVDHLSPAAKGTYQKLTFGNHDKNTAFSLLTDASTIICDDINDKAARKIFYEKVIAAIDPQVKTIDNVVAQLQGTAVKPDIILEKIVESNI